MTLPRRHPVTGQPIEPGSAAKARRLPRVRRVEREDPAYLAWVRGQECAVPGCDLPGEAHHFPHKSGDDWHDRLTVPACPGHHNGGPASVHQSPAFAAEMAPVFWRWQAVGQVRFALGAAR